MEIISSITAAIRRRPHHTARVLVPTMGALHRGHLELIRAARAQADAEGEVVVSIFVNPLQFEPGADLDKYPRPTARDEQLCRDAGVDLLFRPDQQQMYAQDRSVYVDEIELSQRLEGASRPGHFRGVCTVVAKLFNLLQPSAAVFGEKDYQQLAIIRRMVRDLNFAIDIIAVPTVRGSGGLALSSRNQYLSASERREATALYRALAQAKDLVDHGKTSAGELTALAHEFIRSVKSARVDYITIADGETLEPLDTVRPNARMLLAVWIGKTRLIDNMGLL
ncbi:MAG: pantoate--beta-alanine ligase [Chthoniobacterales bacterium]|nr:MAG: pantoate--beta-alanine ligase [Chthoniobacterales bacterium]